MGGPTPGVNRANPRKVERDGADRELVAPNGVRLLPTDEDLTDREPMMSRR
jgi:hypothetical protein